MRLRSLHLEQFRNYSDERVELSDAPVQLFLGPNGAGKTNLLEAVSVLSLTKSCRGRDETEMTQWEKDFYRIRATATSGGAEQIFEVVSALRPRKKKACFVNDVRVGVSSMVGKLPTVTFLPQDLLLFSGPPAERRRFFDELLSQVSEEYLGHLSRYQQFLQQRNALLRRIAAGKDTASSLDAWERELAEEGSHVTLARLELIETLNATFLHEVRMLGEKWEEATLRYERKSSMRDQAGLEEEMRGILREGRERDLQLLSTGSGPHREDWQVYREERALPTFASRGQERVAVLSLLFLEVSYLELRRGEKPVVLLDDAFSELDDAHQSALLDSLQSNQVLMTAARPPLMLRDATVIEVRDGKVMQAELRR